MKIRKEKIAQGVADALRAEIAKGQWDSVLPGYRKLQEYFGVGRPAILKACAILTEEGVLEEAEPKKPRMIARKELANRFPQAESFSKIRIVAHTSRLELADTAQDTLSAMAHSLGPDWSIEYLVARNYYSRSPLGELKRF